MDLSTFLLRLFGFYLIIVGFAYLFRQQFFAKAIGEFFQSAALLLFTGVLNVILGLLVVLNYNVWEWNAKGFLTVLGYLILLKGVSRLFFPYWGEEFWKKFFRGKGILPLALLSIGLGIWLLLRGFHF